MPKPVGTSHGQMEPNDGAPLAAMVKFVWRGAYVRNLLKRQQLHPVCVKIAHQRDGHVGSVKELKQSKNPMIRTHLGPMSIPILGVGLTIAGALAGAEPIEIHLAYLGDTSSTAYIGAKQGLSEANLQGQFLGQTYTLEATSSDALVAGSDPKPAVVLAALDEAQLFALSSALPNTPIFNLTATDDSLRAACNTNLFHVIPSDRMKADAVSQWMQKHKDANVSAQAWHRDFKKYAARELNNRFRKANGIPMDDDAWAGWAAVKMTSDTVAREGRTNPEQLRTYFKEKLRFDGQKGVGLSFRNTGQLRQPLLIVEDDKLVGEAPVRGVVDTTDLDSLGLKNCPK